MRGANGYSNVVVARYPDSALTNTRVFYIDSPGAVLDSVTVSNGYLWWRSGGGAGVYLVRGLITNCFFISNIVYEAGAANSWNYGEAVRIHTGEVWNSLFSYNGDIDQGYGNGTIAIMYSGTVANSVISPSNQARSIIYVYAAGSGLVSNCAVINNRAWNAGVIGVEATNMNLTIVDSCLVVSNNVYVKGPYIYANASNAIIRNCVIANNKTGYGRGIYIPAGKTNILVEKCIITENNQLYPSAVEMYAGTIRNCIITKNTANCGVGANYYAGRCGGVIASNEGTLVENCTIVGNVSTACQSYTLFSVGGAIVRDSAVMRNCIVYSNMAHTVTPTNAYDLWTGPESNGVVQYTCTPSNVTDGVNGCITSNPGFMAFQTGYGYLATGGDFHLIGGSPCVNAGTNTDTCGDYDKDGLHRIDRFSGRIDMGAYEFLSRGFLFSVK